MTETNEQRGLEALEPLVGEWIMEASPPGGPPWPGEGRLSFEWLEGRSFLLERWRVDMPEAPNGVAIIGCDVGNDSCYQLYTDERGVHRVYGMSFRDGEWRLWRDADDPFPQRFVGTLSADGKTITGRWEKSPDGSAWETDFDLVYRKVVGRTPPPDWRVVGQYGP